MKKNASVILLLFVFQFTVSVLFAQDEFELVESVPVETIFEQSTLPRAHDVWLKMINDAKKSIDIETFYFANAKDEPLEEIMTAIKNAGDRGVRVTIIVDSSFYANSDKSVDELEGVNNLTVFKIPMGNIAGGVMHAKYFIVDDENVFVGSQNMDWRALKHIHEMGVRIKNKKIAETFKEVFNLDIAHIGRVFSLEINGGLINSANPVSISNTEFGNVILYPAFSPPKITPMNIDHEEDELLKIIGNAKERLFIEMYSYSPKAKNEKKYYDAIDNALREAAGRGVDIRIIFSDWAIREGATDFIKSLSTVSNIQIKLSTIPQYSEGYIPYARVDHSKFFIADNNISWISTSNWEWSYFNNSRNATIIADNEKVNSELSKVFMRSWDSNITNSVDVNKIYEPVKRN
ncbi:MAG: phospholipase D-like domain-containing protein [Ignavibacteria bacterium]